MTDIENKVYEIAFNIVPTLTEEQVGATFGALKDTMTKLGGSMIAEQAPRPINLAYTMNKVISNKNYKFSSAFFGWVKFEMPASAVDDFKKILDRDENIVRFMILKTVRENTMTPKKTFRADSAKRRSPGDSALETEEMDKEVVDQKIDELIVA